jgi:competence protein ComEA
MRGARGDAGSRLAAQASVRLQRLSRQWRPLPADPALAASDDAPRVGPLDPWQLVLDDAGPPPPVPTTDTATEPGTRSRLSVGPWNRSALRGLVVLVCTALALTGWWWWSGRPRASAEVPTVLATGAPVPGIPTEPVSGSSPAPVIGSSLAPVSGSSPAPAAATDPAPGAVVVHVVGLVQRPGLVTLTVGSRVADAIEAAGGVTRRRASDSVNLARVLVDGEQIVVGPSASAAPPVLPGVAPVTVVDLNTADVAALDQLPGVGPVLAQRIVAWRAANGPFRSVEELGEVSGIGDSIMAQLRPLVRV